MTATPVTSATMSVETVRFDAVQALVKVSGVLDMHTSAPLWAVLRAHLAAGRRFIRLDLCGVTLLDATALSGIVAAHQELLQRRGTLVITGVTSLVARMLRMTGQYERLLVGGMRSDDDLPEPWGDA